MLEIARGPLALVISVVLGRNTNCSRGETKQTCRQANTAETMIADIPSDYSNLMLYRAFSANPRRIMPGASDELSCATAGLRAW